MSELTVINSYMPVMALAEAKARRNAVNQFVRDLMVQDTDYGVIPGTEKPTLYKPGAEKLNTLFGFTSRFIVAEKETDWMGTNHNGEPFFYFSYRCQLWRNEMLVAESDGSCNSMEKKYRYRNADRKCPDCNKSTLRHSKPPKVGWYCWVKIGGCGGQFAENDKRITEQQLGQIINPDIADLVNTIQKMAQKRSLVAATLLAVNASEFFTQDVEDMPGYGDGEVIEGASKPVNRETPKETQPANKPPEQPSTTETTTSPVGNGKTRVITHRDECIELVGTLTAASFDKQAAKLDAAIKNANLAIERGQNETTLHSHADRLKQLRDEAKALLAEPVPATA